jgi:hypothetical protein
VVRPVANPARHVSKVGLVTLVTRMQVLPRVLSTVRKALWIQVATKSSVVVAEGLYSQSYPAVAFEFFKLQRSVPAPCASLLHMRLELANSLLK